MAAYIQTLTQNPFLELRNTLVVGVYACAATIVFHIITVTCDINHCLACCMVKYYVQCIAGMFNEMFTRSWECTQRFKGMVFNRST